MVVMKKWLQERIRSLVCFTQVHWVIVTFFGSCVVLGTVSGCHMTCKECGTQSVSCLVGNCENGCEPHPYITLGRYKECVDHHHTLKSARHCAIKDLYGPGCKPDWTVDYERGYIQAYQDVLTGGNGKTPPVPPERYWAAHYRTRGGHSRADDWFAGYEAGVCSIRSTDVPNWIQIPSSQISREPPVQSQYVIPAASDSRGGQFSSSQQYESGSY